MQYCHCVLPIVGCATLASNISKLCTWIYARFICKCLWQISVSCTKICQRRQIMNNNYFDACKSANTCTHKTYNETWQWEKFRSLVAQVFGDRFLLSLFQYYSSLNLRLELLPHQEKWNCLTQRGHAWVSVNWLIYFKVKYFLSMIYYVFKVETVVFVVILQPAWNCKSVSIIQGFILHRGAYKRHMFMGILKRYLKGLKNLSDCMEMRALKTMRIPFDRNKAYRNLKWCHNTFHSRTAVCIESAQYFGLQRDTLTHGRMMKRNLPWNCVLSTLRASSRAPQIN